MLPTKKPINYNLEVLRGFAAIIVVLGHVIYYYENFNPAYFPKAIWHFQPPAHVALLLFFVLSGFVIGVSQKERLAGIAVLVYLRKRFIRIYPLYFIAVTFGLVIATSPYPVKSVISNLTITQNIYRDVIWENNPLWSLNFEVLFYLLFIPLSFFKIKPLIAFVFFFLLGSINLCIPVNQLITAYSFGYCFWLTGLYIATAFQKKEIQTKVLPIIFFILAIAVLIADRGYISKLFSILRIPVKKGLWNDIIINLEDLVFLPYCFMGCTFFCRT